MDSKPVVFIAGNWCWRHAAGGRVGMLRCLVLVLDMCDPLGNNTFTGVTTGTFFFLYCKHHSDRSSLCLQLRSYCCLVQDNNK